VSAQETKKFVMGEYFSGMLTKLKDKKATFVAQQTKVVETNVPVADALKTEVQEATPSVRAEEFKHRKKKKKKR
jgi:hypothetical protein